VQELGKKISNQLVVRLGHLKMMLKSQQRIQQWNYYFLICFQLLLNVIILRVDGWT